MYDANTHYLNEYEHTQAALEDEWEDSLEDKQEEVIDLAVKLIKKEVDGELFNWVFSEYTQTDDITLFHEDLDSIVKGEDLEWGTSLELITVALEGACISLTDLNTEDLFDNVEDAIACMRKGLWQSSKT